MSNSGDKAIEIIRNVLEVAQQQYRFSYDEQIELWVEFLMAAAEMSALTEQLMEEHDISRPEALELAFEQNPIGLKELIKKVNPNKYYLYNEKDHAKQLPKENRGNGKIATGRGCNQS